MTTARASQIARRSFLGALLLAACEPARIGVAPRPVAPREPAPPVAIDPVVPPLAPSVRADRHAVATENASAAEAARQVLERGGSAADAAIVALLVACVAQPSSIGLGADGFALVWSSAEKRATVLDFRARAPKGLRLREHVAKQPPAGKAGVMVGVPGLVAGIAALHRAAGRIALADLFTTAADLADAGAPLSAFTTQTLAWQRQAKHAPRSVLDLFVVDDEESLPRSIKSPLLSKTLRRIASEGTDAVFQGELAKEIVDAARAAGSALVRADLESYQVVSRPPVAVDWGPSRVLTVPPPSGGGFLLAHVLRMFSPADVKALSESSARLVHTMAEAFRLTNADRFAFVGDPAFTKIDVDAMWDASRLAERRARIKEDATTMPRYPSVGDSGTFHVSVIDADDVAVSVTATLGSSFGAKLATPSGIVLNDALVDFAMDDYGIRATTRGGNFPRGGARPASSMAPTIVVDAERPRLALGASGGFRAPEAILQALFSHLVFGRPLGDAIAAPRFYVPPSGVLQIDAALDGLAADLGKRGEVVEVGRAETSAVSAVAVDRSHGRKLTAAGDPRKGGVGLVAEGVAKET